MKISETTVEVLKNFAAINMSLQFKEGTSLRTVSPQKSVLAEATISEDIPRGFAIFDLNQFLSTFQAFQDPDIGFDEKQITVTNGSGGKAYISYADVGNIITPPDKELSIPSTDVKIMIKSDAMSNALKMAGILELPEVALVGKGSAVYLTALDSKNMGSNKFETPVGETQDEFRLIFKVDNLKLLPRDYDVEVSSKGISRWDAIGVPKVRYFIATETSSSFGG